MEANALHETGYHVEEGWREICDYILERHGHLDILLNGAGVGGSGIEQNIRFLNMEKLPFC